MAATKVVPVLAGETCPHGGLHDYVRDQEAITHHCCQKCGDVVQDAATGYGKVRVIPEDNEKALSRNFAEWMGQAHVGELEPERAAKEAWDACSETCATALELSPSQNTTDGGRTDGTRTADGAGGANRTGGAVSSRRIDGKWC